MIVVYVTPSHVYIHSAFVVSGEVPQDPVVSKTTGHVYERRMIEKEIARTGQCPLTGTDISADDLISVKGYQINCTCCDTRTCPLLKSIEVLAIIFT